MRNITVPKNSAQAGVFLPGQPGRKSVKSVNGYLVSLYFILMKNLSGKVATKKIGEFLAKRRKLEWLEPPMPNGQKTVLDVLTATHQAEHEIKIREWAEDVWRSWHSKHGQTIEKLVNETF